MSNRLMFVGLNRVADAILTLKFDKFLDPLPTKTTIYYHPGVVDIKETFDQYIDTSRFEFVSDAEIINKHPMIESLDPWHKQQLIKLIAVDSCTDDIMIIADADMFNIVPYRYWDNGPVLYYRPAHSNDTDLVGWNYYFENLTGMTAKKDMVFISEFLPLRRTDWTSLREHIEKHTGKNWVQALVDMLKGISFSEYTLLANWMLSINSNTKLTVQNKEFLSGKKIDTLKIYPTTTSIGTFGLELEEVLELEKFINRNIK
jgi:Family of unknown function (DUF6492)